MLCASKFLLKGAKNARTGEYLSKAMNIPRRDFDRLVQQERRAGVPIVSNGDGYFIASNRNEMRQFCESLRRRAAEIKRTRRACMAMLDRIPEREDVNE